MPSANPTSIEQVLKLRYLLSAVSQEQWAPHDRATALPTPRWRYDAPIARDAREAAQRAGEIGCGGEAATPLGRGT